MKRQFSSSRHEVIYKKMLELNSLKENNLQVSNQSNDISAQIESEYLMELNRYIMLLDSNRENHAYRQISSHRKWIGSIIVFGKKVVRKFLKWYIEPITIQQTKFNNAVTPSIGRLTELVTKLIEKNEYYKSELDLIKQQYESKITEVKGELNTLINESNHSISSLSNELIMLQNDNANLVKQLTLSEGRNDELLQRLSELEQKFDEQKALSTNNFTNIFEYVEKNEKISEKLINVGILEESNNVFEKMTYAQSGEDSIVAYILHVLGYNFENVTYVDLGANHAKELSNTYYLYGKGAKGILVEANTDLIPELKFYRNKDIILNNCVDVQSGIEREFYILNGDGLSTTDYEAALSFCEINPNLEIVNKLIIETISYPDLVDKYLGKAPTVLSLDIEGKDMEILQAIDFQNENYRPLIIIIEMISYNTKLNYQSKNNEIIEFLNNKGYEEYAFTGINSIFIDKLNANGRY